MTDNEQIVNLTNALLEMQKRYFTLKDAFDGCAKTMTEVQERNKTLEDLNKKYFNDMRAAVLENSDLHDTLEEKEKHIIELEQSLEDADAENEKLEIEIDNLNESIVNRDRDIEDYRDALLDQEHHIEELKKEVEHWQDQYERELSD